MEGWRQRLHQPRIAGELQQDAFANAVSVTCNVLRPSLTEAGATSACALVIGAPCSGKSLLTRLVIAELSVGVAAARLVVIRLSGLLHGTPAKAWQQLLKQLDAALSKNNAAAEEGENNRQGEGVDQVEDEDEESMKHAVQPFLERIRNEGLGLLLVLDDIHRFATADPLAQTVLYSLLNLLQDGSLRAACIAQTPFIDVTDLLEKRVLSRLAHRKIIVPLPDTADQVLKFLRSALIPALVEQEAAAAAAAVQAPKRGGGRGRAGARGRGGRGRMRGKGRGGKSESQETTSTVEDDGGGVDTTANGTGFGVSQTHAALLGKSDAEVELKWQCAVRELLQDGRTRQAIANHMIRTRVVAPVLQAVDAAVSVCVQVHTDPGSGSCSVSSDVNEAVAIIDESLGVVDTTVQAVLSLTQVQLELLVALRRVEALAEMRANDTTTTTTSKKVLFADVYKEYCKLGRLDEGRMAEIDAAQLVVSESTAARAWETLVDAGLVVRTGNGARAGRPVYCAVAGTQMEEAVDKHDASSVVLKHWAKSAVTKC